MSFIQIKGLPSECPHCQSKNFVHSGTSCNCFPEKDLVKVNIDRTYKCTVCERYFGSREEKRQHKRSQFSCEHNTTEPVYIIFNLPLIYYPKFTSNYIFPYEILGEVCTDCGSYLFTCLELKLILDDVWPTCWSSSTRNPLHIIIKSCGYCAGDIFYSIPHELTHANIRMISVVKNENRQIYEYFFKEDNSLFSQAVTKTISLEKEFYLISNVSKRNLITSERKAVFNEINDKFQILNLYRRDARNFYRKKFGLPLIGEGWISETSLFKLVQKKYNEEKIFFHYRPTWLKGLELDIYIPTLKTGIEYMGVQHYKPVEYFGGLTAFIDIQRRDKLKKELCDSEGVKLLFFDYKIEVNEDNLMKLLGN